MTLEISQEVAQKAIKMSGVKNPYISLEDLETLCKGNEILEEYLEEMVNLCLRYAETVCRFEIIVSRGSSSNGDGSREEIEAVRSSVHDSTITAINVLSRVMKQHDRDNLWINLVASGGRASYGKFAILTAFAAAAFNHNK